MQLCDSKTQNAGSLQGLVWRELRTEAKWIFLHVQLASLCKMMPISSKTELVHVGMLWTDFTLVPTKKEMRGWGYPYRWRGEAITYPDAPLLNNNTNKKKKKPQNCCLTCPYSRWNMITCSLRWPNVTVKWMQSFLACPSSGGNVIRCL